MKVTFTSIFIFLLLICCALLCYLWIDRTITLSYVSESADASGVAVIRLERLLAGSWEGMTEAEVLKKLQAEAALYPNESIIVKREGNIIWFGEIGFNFEQGRLKNIGDQ